MKDLIDRQEAIDAVDKLSDEPIGYLEAAIDALVDLPSAQPEREKGKWTDGNACPFCGFQPWYEHDIHTLSFCPNCGADMRKGEGEKE